MHARDFNANWNGFGNIKIVAILLGDEKRFHSTISHFGFNKMWWQQSIGRGIIIKYENAGDDLGAEIRDAKEVFINYVNQLWNGIFWFSFNSRGCDIPKQFSSSSGKFFNFDFPAHKNWFFWIIYFDILMNIYSRGLEGNRWNIDELWSHYDAEKIFIDS